MQKIEALTGTTPTTVHQGMFGAGITVGVLSDSFDKLKTHGHRQRSQPDPGRAQRTDE